MIDLSKIRIYRMTHIENIPHILQYGITSDSSPNRNPNFKKIGDSSLISKRNQKELDNGKKLGDYIPFYFGWKMPMLYVIYKGYNNVQQQKTEEIVYCVSSIEKMIALNLNFVFTDGHAVDALSKYYDASQAQDIGNLLDFAAIKAEFWKDENDLDLKRRKEAEFLVENDIPLTAILGYVVYNDNAKTKLESFGIPTDKIAVRPKFYF